MQEQKSPSGKTGIQHYKDLKVFQTAYALALEVFEVSKRFPKEEQYSLIDQLRRASRSVAANIVEGWAKRRYPSVFKRHLLDAEGSCSETKLWLDFARDSGYFTPEAHERLMEQCEEIGKMLYALRQNWR